MAKHLPNFLSLLRLLLVVPSFYFHQQHQPALAASSLTLAILTDYWDGKIARWFHAESALGALLDPVADKAVILTLMGLLAFENQVPRWFFALVAFRNISQLIAIPLLSGILKKEFNVRPRLLAKAATAVQFGIIWYVFLEGVFPDSFLARSFIIAVGILECYLLAGYFVRLLQIIRGHHDTFE